MARIKQVFQFKVSLLGIRPEIWRRIQVPETYSFWDLHVAIQDAMGWMDYHLHEFKILNQKIGEKVSIGIPDPDMLDDIEMLPCWELAISDYFSMENPQSDYEYDFGDGWQHVVQLEEIIPEDPKIAYPICIAGEQACPPEDCGGDWGYQNLLKILSNPADEEYESMLTWVGGKYDPDHFDPAEITFDDPRERWEIAFCRP